MAKFYQKLTISKRKKTDFSDKWYDYGDDECYIHNNFLHLHCFAVRIAIIQLKYKLGATVLTCFFRTCYCHHFCIDYFKNFLSLFPLTFISEFFGVNL